MAKSIEIDRKKRLRDEPHKGHNRWHPDVAPVIEAAPGEEVTLQTRDASDLQISSITTEKDLEKLERTVAHPLTGPVYVKGAEPGDLLEIEYLEIVPERYGWTRFAPGGGFLPDLFDTHFVAHWDITPEYATSPQLPGVRIPNGAFMGTAGLAPSHEQLKKWNEGTKAPALEAKNFSTQEWLRFLGGLPEKISLERMKELDDAFGFTKSGNSEILCEWFQHCIRNNYSQANAAMENYLINIGRRKLVKPLYSAMVATPEWKALAKTIYTKARPNYHAVTYHTLDEMVK